jgi:hypothetical protein
MNADRRSRSRMPTPRSRIPTARIVGGRAPARYLTSLAGHACVRCRHCRGRAADLFVLGAGWADCGQEQEHEPNKPPQPSDTSEERLRSLLAMLTGQRKSLVHRFMYTRRMRGGCQTRWVAQRMMNHRPYPTGLASPGTKGKSRRPGTRKGSTNPLTRLGTHSRRTSLLLIEKTSIRPKGH